MIFDVFLMLVYFAIRGIRQPKQKYTYYTMPEVKEYPPTHAHSNALDVASNPWVYGDEKDPRSHAYSAKQYHEREAAARQMAYRKQVKHDEATRELNKWKVGE
jgi:hypothetical protein